MTSSCHSDVNVWNGMHVVTYVCVSPEYIRSPRQMSCIGIVRSTGMDMVIPRVRFSNHRDTVWFRRIFGFPEFRISGNPDFQDFGNPMEDANELGTCIALCVNLCVCMCVTRTVPIGLFRVCVCAVFVGAALWHGLNDV